jgi:spore coat polysaccharide biosynthesis predicted glycosyltransferase SpsG
LKKIQILVDIDPKNGLGHLMRGIAIWQMLSDSFDIYLMINLKHYNSIKSFLNEKLRLHFYTSENLIKKLSEFSVNEIIFFDGYIFDKDFRDKIKKFKFKSIFIDDYGKGNFNCDYVINHAELKKLNYELEEKTKLFYGFKYLMLREIFFKNFKDNSPKNSVLVSFGGTYNPYIKLIIDILLDINFLNKIDIVGHKFPFQKPIRKDLKISFYKELNEKKFTEKIKENNIIICQSSTTALECFVMNKKIIIVKTDDNQSLIFNSLINKKNVIGYNNIKDIDIDNLTKNITFLKNSMFYERNIEYSKNNFKMLIESL